MRNVQGHGESGTVSAQDHTHEEWIIVAGKMAGYEERDDDCKQHMDLSNELNLRHSYGGPDPDPTGTARLQGQYDLLEERLKGRRFRTLHFCPDRNHHNMAEVVDGMNHAQLNTWGNELQRLTRRAEDTKHYPCRIAMATPQQKFAAFIQMMIRWEDD